MFVDTDFPPIKTPDEMVVEWKRVTSMGKTFGGGKEVTRVRQGGIENCWVLASLVCVGWSEQGGESLITHNSKEGWAEVKLWQNGVEKLVKIDDTIPLSEDTPLYAKSTDGTWWVSLVEKAYAKMLGGYHRLSGGLQVHSLQDFTGWASILSPLQSTTFPHLHHHIQNLKGMAGVSSLKEKTSGDETGKAIHATVSLGGDGEPVSLHFSMHENPHEVAEAFCSKHGLAACKKEAIAGFVKGHQDAAAKHVAKLVPANPPASTKTIVKSHSYSILDTQAEGEQVLIHNSWGSGSWEGAERPYKDAESIGTFWVTFKDLLSNFDALHLATPSSLQISAPLPRGSSASFDLPSATTVHVVVAAGDSKQKGFTMRSPHGVTRASPILETTQVGMTARLEQGKHVISVDTGDAEKYHVMVYF
eukprot:TRINITY_DN21612_c0_g1_i1.p1 TRINITY_DN21612_c0_g1~~TRINITY_DN21612_c0_g1_i1.p1  ORF type:complete len:417 (+),score=71.93 TRINITY_DN21612_c0_g1_i1:59-1309(+)